MQRRSFRASACADARYPSLQDVERDPVSRWGMLTLGGLVLGGPACTPVHAESGAEHAAAPPASPQPRPDSGAPTPPLLPPPGVPIPQRIDPPPSKPPGKTDLPAKVDPPAKRPKSSKASRDDEGKQDGNRVPNKIKTARNKASPEKPPSQPRVEDRVEDEPPQ